MKKLKCNFCNEEWYIEEVVLKKVSVCPFCTAQIWEKNEIKVFDSLDKAIYGAINSKGLDIFQSLSKLSGYLLDIAPELKKEIRIFSKTMNEEYVIYLKEAFEKDEIGVEGIINKLRYLFIEDEGLSEKWADMLCESLQGAIMYTKGIGMSSITADVIDIENFWGNQKFEEKQIEIKQDVQNVVKDDEKEEVLKIAQNYVKKKNYKKAIEEYRQIANSGYVPAYNGTANTYYLMNNYKKAWKWYLKSAEAGDKEGQYFVGYFYSNGLHVQKNLYLAVKWYKKSAEQGHIKALLALANAYNYGWGISKDAKIAADYFEKARRLEKQIK